MDETQSRSNRYNAEADSSLNQTKKKKRRLALWVRLVLFLIVILTIAFLYAYFIGTKGLEIREYKVVDSHINTSFHGFKIVHLSDIHFGRTVKEEELKNIVNKVNYLKPDIVVITGDLLDEDTPLTEEQQTSLINELKRIDVSIKKYSVTGNHDYNLEIWEKIIEESSFVNLNDNYDLIYKNSNEPIIISGISSSYASGTISHKLDKTNEYLSKLKENDIKPIYSILILHEPDFINDIETNKFNLVLAGHSHNGQINIPFIKNLGMPKFAEEYYDAYYQVNNTKLYISGGLGTSIVDLRLFCKPSFNFYRITNK